MIADSDNPICLIIPPSPFLLDERVFVNLGILHVASALEEAGYLVDLLDLSGVVDYEQVVTMYLTITTSTIFGITATTPQMPQIIAITAIIRSMHPADPRIIIGGPHVTLVQSATGRAEREMLFLLKTFDVVVSGDGEKAILAAVADNPPPFINANSKQSPLFVSSAEFDHAPLAARHLIDLASYHYNIDAIPSTSIIGQLGCPFSCRFCGGRESPCLRIPRIRSTESILTEIKHLYTTYGYRGFMFYDDELNVNPHFAELLQALHGFEQQIGLPFRYRGFVKSELFTEAQAAAMYRAGFRWILSGFESGSPRILHNIRKRATREDNSRCITIAHKHGLKVKALMSLGHPGESEETIAATKKWLLAAQPDDLDIATITPYPGTTYFDRAVPIDTINGSGWVYTDEETGDRLYCRDIDYCTTAIYYKGDPYDNGRFYTYTDHLSGSELARHQKTLYTEIRAALGITICYTKAASAFDHSMGTLQPLPRQVFKSSATGELACR